MNFCHIIHRFISRICVGYFCARSPFVDGFRSFFSFPFFLSKSVFGFQFNILTFCLLYIRRNNIIQQQTSRTKRSNDCVRRDTWKQWAIQQVSKCDFVTFSTHLTLELRCECVSLKNTPQNNLCHTINSYGWSKITSTV